MSPNSASVRDELKSIYLPEDSVSWKICSFPLSSLFYNCPSVVKHFPGHLEFAHLHVCVIPTTLSFHLPKSYPSLKGLNFRRPFGNSPCPPLNPCPCCLEHSWRYNPQTAHCLNRQQARLGRGHGPSTRPPSPHPAPQNVVPRQE